MNLFINAVSNKWKLILFDDNRDIVSEQDIVVLWNESSKLTSILDDFLISNDINYSKIENIVVVSWPGSFTWVRAISLIVNTIGFTCNTRITDISFFDLFSSYPIIKSSSKRDLFVKKDKNTIIDIVKNEDFLEYTLENNIKNIYGDLNNNLIVGDIKLNENIKYIDLIKNIIFTNKKIITPLYIKKPNIS